MCRYRVVRRLAVLLRSLLLLRETALRLGLIKTALVLLETLSLVKTTLVLLTESLIETALAAVVAVSPFKEFHSIRNYICSVDFYAVFVGVTTCL